MNPLYKFDTEFENESPNYPSASIPLKTVTYDIPDEDQILLISQIYRQADNTAIQSDWTDDGLEMSNYKDEHIYYRITTPMIPKDLTCLLDCFTDLDDDFLTGSLSIQIDGSRYNNVALSSVPSELAPLSRTHIVTSADGSGNQRLILNNGVCSDRNLAEDQTFAYKTVSQLGKLLIISSKKRRTHSHFFISLEIFYITYYPSFIHLKIF